MVLPNGPVVACSDVEETLFEFVDGYDRAYETAAAKLSLTAAQACVLGRLHDGRTMGALADELGCDPSNVTQIVSRLEALGLVARSPDPRDRRARIVARTARGDDVNRQFEQAFDFARVAVAQLSTNEQAQLMALLRKALG